MLERLRHGAFVGHGVKEGEDGIMRRYSKKAFSSSWGSVYKALVQKPMPQEKPEPEPEKELSEKEKFEKVLSGMKLALPVVLPPTTYRTCMRCSISVDVSVRQGRCTACGGPLTNR